MPGASPTIRTRAFGSPKDDTGALNQSGSFARACARKSASRGHSRQLRSGSVARSVAGGTWPFTLPLACCFSIVEVFIATASRRHGRRALQELRRMMPWLARRRTLGRIAAELRLQLYEIGKDVSLPAQLIGDHRRLAGDGRDHGHPYAAALHGFNQRT